MTGQDRLELARRMYEAFASGDRDYVEACLSEDFRFSSPLDVDLDRAGYFERCWPGAGQGQRFDFVRMVQDGDVVIVTYEMTQPDGSRGRNAEILTTGSVLALGAMITLAGATIAPTVASLYSLVDSAAPAGTQTEAFSWLLTASLLGAALGAAAGGVLAQRAGATATFAFVAAAGGVTVLVALIRWRGLAPEGSLAAGYVSIGEGGIRV